MPAVSSHEKTRLWRISDFHFFICVGGLDIRMPFLGRSCHFLLAPVCDAILHCSISFWGRNEAEAVGNHIHEHCLFLLLVAFHYSIDSNHSLEWQFKSNSFDQSP
jgi:hypothetical protein